MIGYYVHHHGSGHLHRATTLAGALGLPVTGLSSLPRPDGWTGDWIRLDRDDTDGGHAGDPTAGGLLHWAPLGDPGLLGRMGAISAWLAGARPELLVSDVSVEVTMLARLHGVPVVSVVLPGDRSDRPHQWGFAASHALVAFWPEEARGTVRGLEESDDRRLHRLGGLSRHPICREPNLAGGRRTVVVLGGRGGGGPTARHLDSAREQTPAWDWEILGGAGGAWVTDPFPLLCAADVVVTHAGQNAVAEVAAVRRPAVIIPAERPHDEQRTTARVLARGPWPVVLESTFPTSAWSERLDHAASLDGRQWSAWCDGGAARRFAQLVRAVLLDLEVAR